MADVATNGKKQEEDDVSKIDFKVPAKIAVWFLETGRFLPVSIRVPWFLFWFWMQKRCCTLKSSIKDCVG